MLFKFKPQLTNQQLVDEKLKDYRTVLWLQVVITLVALLLKDIFILLKVEPNTSLIIRDSLFLSLGGLYMYILWDMLRNFTKSETLIITLFVLILITFAVTVLVVNPIIPLIESKIEQGPYLLMIHLVLFIVEIVLIYHSIQDLFGGEKPMQERLWGSASIFMMIGISFGSLYDIIHLSSPGSVNISLVNGLDSYTACIGYSMAVIGGLEPFAESAPIVQKIGIIEAVWANLYVVLVVGRLLSK